MKEEGDESMRTLARAYGGGLYGFALKRLGDPQLADLGDPAAVAILEQRASLPIIAKLELRERAPEGIEVESIGCKPDGFNINAGFGATAPQALVKFAELLLMHATLVLFNHHGEAVEPEFPLPEPPPHYAEIALRGMSTMVPSSSTVTPLAATRCPIASRPGGLSGDKY